jgi:circadian clock protein KaiC
MNDETAASGAEPSSQDLFSKTGLTAQRTILVLGPRGSGKTVFALQSLLSAARAGEPGMLVSFDQSPGRLLQQAAFFGWEVPELQKRKLISLVSFQPDELAPHGRFDLDDFLDRVRVLARKTHTRRIVFDSFQLLLKLLKECSQDAKQTFRLREWFFENELTGIITADVVEDLLSESPRYAFLQFMADCVVALDFQFSGEHFQRALRVVKYRGRIDSDQEVYFRITRAGLELSPSQTTVFATGLPTLPKDSEFDRVHRQLAARLLGLDLYLEVKQAEWDFLIEKSSPKGKAESDAADTPHTELRWAC